MDECSDPKRLWYPYRRICYVTMEEAAASAKYDALHETATYHDGTFTSWAKEHSKDHPYRYDSGVTIRVAERDLTPHDLFTTDVNASPVASPGAVE